MSVEYLEITDSLYIPDCVAIQKDVFHLSSADQYPFSFFSLLIRQEHPLGMLIGCFTVENHKRRLIGLVTAIADTKPNSLYCQSIAIHSDFQNGRHGLNLLKELRKCALKRNVAQIYGVYDPLEANLAKLYAHIGLIPYKYIASPYKQNSDEVSQVDKILFRWDIKSERVEGKLLYHTKTNFNEAISNYPIVNDVYSKLETILIEIPNRYIELVKEKSQEALEWRSSTRRLFTEYINNRGYIVLDCISGKTNNNKKTFYVLQKTNNE